MLITSQPCSLNQRLSARVLNRGPWMTTTVPRSCTAIPSSAAAAAASGRSSGQYGSAVLTCTVCGPL
jgi:hypothetical protein